jgi:hypothetical protein
MNYELFPLWHLAPWRCGKIKLVLDLFVRLKFLDPEYSGEEKFVSRTIPTKSEGIIPRCSAAEFGSTGLPWGSYP